MITKKTIRKYFNGVKFSEIYPALEIVAKQNGLKLGKVREFRIAQSIIVNSIINN